MKRPFEKHRQWKLMKNNLLRIGTAGWSLTPNIRDCFPLGNSLLEKYSRLFNAVEINSSFYKSHRKTTYERWAAVTPPDFQFAVKMPKQITHTHALVDIEVYLDSFLKEISGLQTKLGPLLIQLSPGMIFEPKIVNNFFALLLNRFNGKLVLEPRHISWAQPEAVTMLQAYNIGRVIADPVKVPIDPTIKQMFSYYRLHGSPDIYSSSYDIKFLDELSKNLTNSSWVIFDNTRLGAAIQNALDLKNRLKKSKK